jgi:uncharacterized protein YlxW (UPF0749 family)
VVIVLLGVATGTAAAGVRAESDDQERARTSLVSQVRDRSATAEQLAGQVAALRQEVDGMRAATLTADTAGRSQAAALSAAELVAAVTPVSGPGIEVRVGDAGDRGRAGSAARPVRGTDADVTDRDLQALVNGVWGAGAEAVSVNGLRLTARSAIRFAGQAVLVDFRPVSPPYVVQAIGDPGALQADFEDSPTGRRLTTWARLNAVPYSVTSAADLRLPAGSVLDPAVAIPGGGS